MTTRRGRAGIAWVVLLALAIPSLAWAEQVPPGMADVSGGGPVEPVRSAYLAGRYEEAVLLVDRALVERPVPPAVSGELHFWRGASLRRLGRSDEALVALDAARRERFKSPELALERAFALRALGKTQEAQQEYQEAERRLEDDPERRLRFSEEWRRAHAKEPDFRLTITPQAGYDSNIVGLNRDAPIQDDSLDEKSFYTGAVLAAKYHVVKSDERVVFLEARSEERLYASEPDLDYTDNTLTALGRVPLFEAVAFEVRGAHGEAWLKDEGHARTVRTAGPALLWSPLPELQVRIFGDWTSLSYYDADIPAEQDRDGTLKRGGLVVGIDLGAGWSVGPMVSFGRYDAEGDDFDARDVTAGAGLTTGEMLGCVTSITFAITFSDYDHPNSLTGFAENREDRILSLTVTVTIRKLEEWIGYAPTVGFTFVDHRSNVDAYDYDRWEPRVELGIAALTF